MLRRRILWCMLIASQQLQCAELDIYKDQSAEDTMKVVAIIVNFFFPGIGSFFVGRLAKELHS
jgi:hypothetical protein